MSAGNAFKASSRLLVVVVGCLALAACSKQPPPKPVAEPSAPTQAPDATAQQSQPKEAPELPPPTLADVQGAVKRIFQDAVVIDADHKPGFLVGDFNGDLSQDLAVVLKPAQGKLSELNQEFPKWIAREPLKDVLLPKSKAMSNPAARPSPNPAAGQTVRFEQNDVLLAIIHGFGPTGWRNPEATQTHLLRDVVGANQRTLRFKDVAKAYKGRRPFPVIYGDLIEETLIGQAGFIHFAGGTYGWYDPKNFRDQTAPMSGHSPMSRMR